jgi:hypothetical protein
MDWYIVIKTINGRRYRYRQKTWREGGRVRTRSEYLGPAGDAFCVPSIAADAATLPLPFTSERSIKPETAAEAFLLVMSPEGKTAGWEHHWDWDRSGPSLVTKIPEIETVLKELQVRWGHDDTGAYYSPHDDRVNIPDSNRFLDKNGQSATQAYYVVVFHEIVHWTGVKARLARSCFDDYETEELVAELGAVMLMRHFGLELGNIGRHAHYFQQWLSRTPNKRAAKATAKYEAERAVRYILERGIIST